MSRYSLRSEYWWDSAKADTPEEAAAFCKKLGTGQCAAICLSHMSNTTTGGNCPEAPRVWMRRIDK